MTRRAADRVSVLVVTPRYPPQVGGAATYVAMLAGWLRADDGIVRVGVLAPYVRGARIVERDGTLEIYRLMLPRPSRPLFRLVARLASDALMLVAILTLKLTRGYGVLHVHGSLSRIGGVVANRPLEAVTRALRLRGVLDLRDPIVVPRRSAAWRVTICASRSIQAGAVAAGIDAASCHYLPPPVDVARIQMLGRRARTGPPRTGTNGDYICYVGEITASKGVKELVDAFRLLAPAQSRLELVLVGPVVARTVAELAWPGRLAANPKIRWLGELRWEDTIAVIANADLVVVPSRAKQEGIPRVCLEAVALERKVLFPAGIDEFEDGNQQWVLSDTSAEGIAKAIGGALARSDHPQYDLAAHDPAAVFSHYLALYR